jgi:hypothetical protein
MFKVGDKVKNINTGKIVVVRGAPGNSAYDEVGFACASEGFTIKNGGWDYQKSYIKISKEVRMTDKKMLEELFLIADKQKKVVAGQRVEVAKDVLLYVDAGDYRRKANIEDMYFEFEAFGFTVNHGGNETLQVEGKINYFRQFKFSQWAKKIEEALAENETPKTIVIDGKTYKLVEQPKKVEKPTPTDCDDIPF